MEENRTNKTKVLNARQIELAKILYKNKDVWRKRKDYLSNELQHLYNVTNDSDKDIYFKHSARELTRDIQVLNGYADESWNYVIISNSYLGIKIATCDDDYKLLQNDKIKTLKSLKRYWNKISKISYETQNHFNLNFPNSFSLIDLDLKG